MKTSLGFFLGLLVAGLLMTALSFAKPEPKLMTTIEWESANPRGL